MRSLLRTNSRGLWILPSIFLAVFFVLGGPRPALGQDDAHAYSFLLGSWEGELEYLDYGDDSTRVRLSTSLQGLPSSDGRAIVLRFSYEEPDGRIVTSSERLEETADGVELGDLWQVEERSLNETIGVYRLVLRRSGEDNGRPASIVNTVLLDGAELTITTMITYLGSTDSLQRHQYRFRRVD